MGIAVPGDGRLACSTIERKVGPLGVWRAGRPVASMPLGVVPRDARPTHGEALDMDRHILAVQGKTNGADRASPGSKTAVRVAYVPT